MTTHMVTVCDECGDTIEPGGEVHALRIIRASAQIPQGSTPPEEYEVLFMEQQAKMLQAAGDYCSRECQLSGLTSLNMELDTDEEKLAAEEGEFPLPCGGYA